MKIPFKEKIREKMAHFLSFSKTTKSNQNLLLKHFDYMLNYNQKKSKVIYTCITGNYDGLQLHHYLNPEYDYVCFTDNENILQYKNYGAWRIRPLEFEELDNTKNARWHKTHPHLFFSDYTESIWIDGNFNFTSKKIFEIIDEKKCGHNILSAEHWRDDCIFKEIENVRKMKFDTTENIDKIERLLRNNNMPEHYGLNETNIVFRKHNDKEIIEIMEEWWSFIRDYTKRDQLSLSYVLFKHGIKPADINIPNLRHMNKKDVFFSTHN